MTRTLNTIQADIDKLESLSDAYRLYFTVADDEGVIPVFAGNRGGLRRRIHRMLGPAERIMEATGTNAIRVVPPAAVGGPAAEGLAAAAFAEEKPQFKEIEPRVHLSVLDAINLTIGVLEDELGSTRDFGPSPIVDGKRDEPREHRFPKLILERLRSNVPKWALVVERVGLFLAALVVLVGTLGSILGWRDASSDTSSSLPRTQVVNVPSFGARFAPPPVEPGPCVASPPSTDRQDNTIDQPSGPLRSGKSRQGLIRKEDQDWWAFCTDEGGRAVIKFEASCFYTGRVLFLRAEIVDSTGRIVLSLRPENMESAERRLDVLSNSRYYVHVYDYLERNIGDECGLDVGWILKVTGPLTDTLT